MPLVDLPPELLCILASFLLPPDISSLFRTCKQLYENHCQKLAWSDALRRIENDQNIAWDLSWDKLSAKQIECLATRSYRSVILLRHVKRKRGFARHCHPSEVQSVRVPLKGFQSMVLVLGGRYLFTVHDHGTFDLCDMKLCLWDLGISPLSKLEPIPIASYVMDGTIIPAAPLELRAIPKDLEGQKGTVIMLAVVAAKLVQGPPYYTSEVSVFEVNPSLLGEAFTKIRSTTFDGMYPPTSWILSSTHIALVSIVSRQLKVWDFRNHLIANVSCPQFHDFKLLLLTQSHMLIGFVSNIDVLKISELMFCPKESSSPPSQYILETFISLHPYSSYGHPRSFSFSVSQFCANKFIVGAKILITKPDGSEARVTLDVSFSLESLESGEERPKLEVLTTGMVSSRYLPAQPHYRLPMDYWVTFNKSFCKFDFLGAFIETSQANKLAELDTEPIVLHTFSNKIVKSWQCFCPVTGRLVVAADNELLVMDLVEPLAAE